MVDPFAEAPEETTPEVEEQQVEESAPEPVKKAPTKKVVAKSAQVASSEEGKVVVTLKGGTGFDAPWIVIHAADVQGALGQFTGENALALAELMERSQTAGRRYVSLAGTPVAAAPAAARRAPRQATEAPAGVRPAPGPGWTYKTGVGKTGKSWKAWMPPRGSNEQPVWL